VKVFLVRHARAVKRGAWLGANEGRPLTAAGRRQAVGLVDLLQGEPVAQIVSSPHLRCRQSVEPLAATRGLRVTLDHRLGEDEPLEKAMEVVDALGAEPAVVCAHGDLLPGILGELETRGTRVEGRVRFEKGSAWVVERRSRRDAHAVYLPPCDTPAHRRIAVLDMGSTSFHLLVADTTPDGDLERVVRQRKPLRLGAVIASGSRVPDDAFALAVETTRMLRQVAEEAGAEFLLPVATAALREADNGPALAAAIEEALGVPVRILSGEEEARIIFTAFRGRHLLVPGPNLGMDLGGGSLELAIGDARGISWETTLRLGVARLSRELVASDPTTVAEAEAVRERVRQLLAHHRNFIHMRSPSCVATGGTVRALARLLAARQARPRAALGGFFVEAEALTGLTRSLVSSSHAERLQTPGMRRDRVDLLPTGALVLDTVVHELGLRGFRVSDWGLREGTLLEALGHGGDFWPR
jgi:exopolyphosphatase/guanosine-5'-triphosphate,3'-diphosphate pyrophosphatase